MVVALAGQGVAQEVNVGLGAVALGHLAEGLGQGLFGLAEHAQIWSARFIGRRSSGVGVGREELARHPGEGLGGFPVRTPCCRRDVLGAGVVGGPGCRGCRRWRGTGGVSDLLHLDCRILEQRAAWNRVPVGHRQLVGGRWVPGRGCCRRCPSSRSGTGTNTAPGRMPPTRAGTSIAPRRESTRTRSPSAMPSGCRVSRLTARPRRRARPRVQAAGPAGLGAGVEVVDGAAGGEPERVLRVGFLVRRVVVGGLEEGPAAGSPAPGSSVSVTVRAGDQVVAVGLAVVGVGGEHAVGVEPVGAVGVLVVARPLDAAAAAQLVVAEARCSRRAGRAMHSFQASNASSGVAPVDQRVAVRSRKSIGGRSRGRCRGRCGPRRAARPPSRTGARCGRRW